MEEITINPIICIGNYHQDKKIKELMKVCNTIELKSPTVQEITNIIDELIPTIDVELKQNLIHFIQGDLRKLNSFYKIYKNNPDILKNEMIQNIFQMKQYNDDTKQITQKLINNKYSIDEHTTVMNETDRTIVGLLWHENIVDVLNKLKIDVSIPVYLKLLENICFADYIDRITFQKQIWQFNEMSSIIKTFKNNKLFHDSMKKKIKYNPTEVRFTKVLTKYSTEYNNSLFIQNLCYQLGMDKKDLFSFFLDLKNKPQNDIINNSNSNSNSNNNSNNNSTSNNNNNNNDPNNIMDLFINCEITKLDIQRIYRYLDKYTKEDAIDDDENEINSLDEAIL